MNKKLFVLFLVSGLVAAAVAQEVPRWISGSQMYSKLIKGPSVMGSSEIAITPEVIYIGTNATVTAGKFYVLQSGGNWVLADESTANSGVIGLAYSNKPSLGMILKGEIYSGSWTSLVYGTELYLGTAGNVSSTVPDNVRYVGSIVGSGILRMEPMAVAVHVSVTSL